MAPFFIKAFKQYFICGPPLAAAFKMVLPQEVELGAHSNIMLFTQELQCSYVGLPNPWGTTQPQQCSACGILKPWKPKLRSDLIVLACSNCGRKLPPILKPASKLVCLSNDQKSRSTAGVWYYVEVGL